MNVKIRVLDADETADVGWVDADKIPALVALVGKSWIYTAGYDPTHPMEVTTQIALSDGAAFYEIIVDCPETDG